MSNFIFMVSCESLSLSQSHMHRFEIEENILKFAKENEFWKFRTTTKDGYRLSTGKLASVVLHTIDDWLAQKFEESLV